MSIGQFEDQIYDLCKQIHTGRSILPICDVIWTGENLFLFRSFSISKVLESAVY